MNLDLLAGVTSAGVLDAVLAILVSFVLAVGIAWIYKKTHRGVSYSQSYVFTLILLPILVALVVLVIGSNLATAFTLVGAFTIIRFRTAVKDTRDTAFIFWALVVGMAIGTHNYVIALLATVLVAMIVLFLTKLNFGAIRQFDYILNFWLPTAKANESTYAKVFEEFLKFQHLLNMSSREQGAKLEYTFNIRFVENKKNDEFIQKLSNIAGIEHVNLLTSRDDVEY